MTTLDARSLNLSCYTGNLVAYLAAEFPQACQTFADSVHLALRADPADELAFSHHRFPLHRLPDATRLAYGTAPTLAGALAGVRAELSRHGRCLVVAENSRLPWSPSYGTAASAPHWVLVDDYDHGMAGGRWHLTDVFSGLMPDGEQSPFQGWLGDAELAAAMTPPPQLTPEQRRRNDLAFGVPVPQPNPAGPQWLRREPDDGATASLIGDWLRTDQEVLPFVADYFARHGQRASRYVDDLWTAARHRAFAHRLRGNPAAEAAWASLPGALRFAVDSAARGRPRTSLLRSTLEHLLEQESRLSPAAGPAPQHTGSGAPPAPG